MPENTKDKSRRIISDSPRALERARRALMHLEEKAAGFGILHIPTDLQIELEEKRKEVAEIEAQLGLSSGKNAAEDSSEGKWLTNIGLIGNPFRHWIAEREEELRSYLIQPQVLRPLERRVRGDGDVSQWIVFAESGYGKTALRQMIAQSHYPQKLEDDVLCVTCGLEALETVIGYAGGSLEVLDSIHYVKVIQELILSSVLSEPERHKAFSEFIFHLGLHQRDAKGSTPRQELKSLVEFIRQHNFRYLLCLVDQVDESTIVEAQPAKMVQFLKPLMRLSLQGIGIAFRYFLPHSLESLMQEQRETFRLDRYEVIHLTWAEEDLQHLIMQRLSAFSKSRPDAYISLGQLCEPRGNFDTPIDLALIRLAEGSPRAVVWLANRLIQLHCQTDNPPRFIQPETWERVQLEWQMQGRNQIFGLFAQGGGFFLVGERIYFQGREIVLTEKSDALLRCLVRMGDNICTKERLIRAGWPGDDPGGVSDAALAEAIRRMKMELDEQESDSRWVTAVRGRGYSLRRPKNTERATTGSKTEGGEQ